METDSEQIDTRNIQKNVTLDQEGVQMEELSRLKRSRSDAKGFVSK